MFKLRRGFPVLLAGDPQAQGDSDGVGNNARFSYVRRMTADAAGNVYVIDRSRLHQILRVMEPSRQLRVLQNLLPPTSTVRVLQPCSGGGFGLVVEESGNIIVLDNDVIRR